MKLKTKLFTVSIKLKNVMITFVATILLVSLSEVSLTAVIPWLFGIFVYSDFTSRVTSKLSFGMFLIFEGNLCCLLHMKEYF